jgi:fucose permease
MKEKSVRKVSMQMLPVLFGFFVMGFVDVVGVATSYVKADFHLSETVAGMLPSMIFIWFLLLSIPTAVAMNRTGRKKIVQISNVITVIGMTIPFISYNFATCMTAFALLGVGNTMLQVSLNPLLTNVVKGDALTSSLTAGQVIKAVSSFLGPVIAAVSLNYLGNWKFIFPVFAGITLISALWLLTTPIVKEAQGKVASLTSTFGLLKDRTVLFCFLGIVFVVGVDVGMNTVTPKLLMEGAGFSLDRAGFGSSVYFLCRTMGALIGAVLLTKISGVKYYKIHIFIALFAVTALYFLQNGTAVLIMAGITGYACACLFPIIFSKAIKSRPGKANEISGLMITGVVGGAITPPLMGGLTDWLGTQIGSLLVITACLAYLICFVFLVKPENN